MGRRDTFLLSILTLVTALGWIVFDVYHASIENTIPQNVEEQLAPITPTFNKVLINDLKKREHIDPLSSSAGNIQFLPPQVGVPTGSPSAGQTQSPQ